MLVEQHCRSDLPSDQSSSADVLAIAPLRIRKQTRTTPPRTPPPGPISETRSTTSTGTLLTDPPSRPLPKPTQKRSSHEYLRSFEQTRPRANSRLRNSQLQDKVHDHSSSAQGEVMVNDKDSSPRGGTQQPRRTDKPLPDSPGPDLPDKEPPYARTQQGRHSSDSEPESVSTTFVQDYYPAPTLPAQRQPPAHGQHVNRLVSTASISTTKASRGSPPPPETPSDTQPPQAQYPFTSQAYHEQIAQQARVQASQKAATHIPNDFHGPKAGTQAVSIHPARSQDILPSTTFTPRLATATPQRMPESRLEQDMQRLRLEDPPPPAYAKVHSPILEEKALATDPAQVAVQSHPAFARQRAQSHPQTQPQGQGQGQGQGQEQGIDAGNLPKSTPSPPISQTTPPPLPEGWISHVDAKSGKYYYIHIPTQATQWDFPKGPTPNNLPESHSPTYAGSVYNVSSYDRPLGSPAMIPQYATYPSSLYNYNMSPMASPTAAGFLQAPPSAGLEQFKVQPANGVYFGPYLRYTNMDIDNGVWYASVMLITDVPNPPTIHIHESMDLSPNPRQLAPLAIRTHQKWTFYRYDIDLAMSFGGDRKWTYAITSHLGCTRYEFTVAGRRDTAWRFMAHSGNDFSMNVNQNERTRLGGLGLMWKDVLQKNAEVGGFHVQIGLGNQICADRLWKDIPGLRQWTAISGKENRRNAPWSTQIEEEVRHAYFHYYTSHFDQPHLREAFASIPHVLTLDDHEIFDGFGSYPDYLQHSNIFRNIGRVGLEAYLLFQHHTTLELLRSPTSFPTKITPNGASTHDLFTITGFGWHFLKYLGPSIVLVGPDCRSERSLHNILSGPSYQGLFPKVALLPPCVQHVLWLLPTPVIYPRFDMAENLLSSFATGKKVVTGSFNALGKVTGAVAGIVGAKAVVNEGFNSVKKAVGKSGLMSGVLSPFGELDVMDELRDQWTHESKDLERTYLIRTLQTVAKQKSIRMTFLSGGTNCSAAGLLHDPNDASASTCTSPTISASLPPPSTPGFTSQALASSYFPAVSSTSITSTSASTVKTPSHRTMYQLVTPSIVNAPPSSTTLKLMYPSHSSLASGTSTKPIYIPANGVRSSDSRAGAAVPSDTKEDMLEVFGVDVDGRVREGREGKRLMGRRGWIACVGFDPVFVREAFAGSSAAGSQWSGSGMRSNGHNGDSEMSRQQLSNRLSWDASSQTTLTPSRNGTTPAPTPGLAESVASSSEGGRISLAFDFMVQADGAMVAGGGSATVKYGPVVVPALDYGR